MPSPHLQAKLPTLDRLGIKQEEIDPIKSDPNAVHQIVSGWLSNLSKALETKNTSAILSVLQPDAFWRDLLALTWDIRSFYTHDIIERFIRDRVLSELCGWKDIKLDSGEGKKPVLTQPFPDLVWIQLFISFKVNVGSGVGVVRLVPTHSSDEPASGEKLTWKAYSIFTALMDLEGHPELLGPLRNHNPNHGFWPADREREVNYLDREPAVVIVGAGQCGLATAARLKVLGVDTLIIEKKQEVGQVNTSFDT
jgi:hypothetical protein